MIRTTTNYDVSVFTDAEKACIFDMARASRVIYNAAARIAEEQYSATGKYVGKYSLDVMVRKDIPEYRSLLSTVARNSIYSCDANYQTFFKLQKNGKKTARPPRPSEEKALYPVMYSGSSMKMTGECVRLSIKKTMKEQYGIRGIVVRLPRSLVCLDVRSVKLIPRENGKIDVAFSYACDAAKSDSPKGNILAIDLGVNNFCACVDTVGGRPFLISGGRINDILHEYDQKMAYYKPLARLNNPRGTTRRIEEIIKRKDNRLKYEVHAIANYIISYAESHDIGTIAIGIPGKDRYAALKDEAKEKKLGSMFPFGLFQRYLEYRCKARGIRLKAVEEAFTSKCDSLALESVEHHDVYLGERVARGLFKSSTGKLINADINAAVNIARQAGAKKSWQRELIEDKQLLQPRRISCEEYHRMQRKA